MKRSILIKIISLTLILAFSFQFSQAASVTDLNKQLQQKQQALDASQSAAANKALEAQSLSKQITNLDDNIKSTEQKIAETGNQIGGVQTTIDSLSSSIDLQNQQLTIIKQKLNSALVEIYRFSNKSDWQLIFNNETLGNESNQAKYVQAVEIQVKSLFTQVETAKQELEKQKRDQESKRAELDSLKNQQESYKSGAEYQKTQKDKLLGMTVQQQQQYLELAEQYKDEIAKIQAQMRTLRGTSSWGTQIVSGSGISWYYSQTGNYTRMGDSYETINDSGCLITSMAMVATFHHHNISPTAIATTYGIFNQHGYFQGFSSSIGVSIGGSRAVDWSTVDDQISSGRPVIISIYLPSVGPVNGDGSSHFVVIYGRSGSSYLMADPIGPGRGYNMNQVRSMKLVTP